MTTHPVALHTGDLARRVDHRQAELRLSTKELARLAGMDAAYLEYLKTSPSVSLPAGALVRLADALSTTTTALVGGEVDRSPGRGRAGVHPMLEVLSPKQCEEHLQSGGIGRVVYSTARGPVALPVNFELLEGDIVFRTTGSVASGVELNETVGFEVDRIDDAMSEGWSVLVSGTPSRIEDPIGRRQLAALDIEPWAGGSRDIFMRITTGQISGRVIVQEAAPRRRPQAAPGPIVTMVTNPGLSALSVPHAQAQC